MVSRSKQYNTSLKIQLQSAVIWCICVGWVRALYVHKVLFCLQLHCIVDNLPYQNCASMLYFKRLVYLRDIASSSQVGTGPRIRPEPHVSVSSQLGKQSSADCGDLKFQSFHTTAQACYASSSFGSSFWNNLALQFWTLPHCFINSLSLS